jgi:hypothetical protein
MTYFLFLVAMFYIGFCLGKLKQADAELRTRIADNKQEMK